jgi:hypothetical protein
MGNRNWSALENEAVVADYLEMMCLWLSGMPINKSQRRRAVQTQLDNRSEKAVEDKRRNISAALLEAGFSYLPGYKPLFNYQHKMADILYERLPEHSDLLRIAAADADAPIAVPDVKNLLSIVRPKPMRIERTKKIKELVSRRPLTTNYVEREARNALLGKSGEEFILRFETERLCRAGKENLAAKIEHVSVTKGDGAGFDILSFEETGRERLIEVKTTKYGQDTPFFVTRNEISVSEGHQIQYHIYRLFEFRSNPALYMLRGAISATCELLPSNFSARPK